MRKSWFTPRNVANGILWLVGAAMQIGGWVNDAIAYLLLGIACLWSIVAIIHWRREKARVQNQEQEVQERIEPMRQVERRQQYREQYRDRAEIPTLLLQMYERAKALAQAQKIPLTGEQAEAVSKTLSLSGSIPEHIPEWDATTNESSGRRELERMLDTSVMDINAIINKLLKILVNVQSSMSLHNVGTIPQTNNDDVYQGYLSRVRLLQSGLPNSINSEIDACIVSLNAIANTLNWDFTSVSTPDWVGMQLQYLLPSMDSWARIQRDTTAKLIERFLLGEDIQ